MTQGRSPCGERLAAVPDLAAGWHQENGHAAPELCQFWDLSPAVLRCPGLSGAARCPQWACPDRLVSQGNGLLFACTTEAIH